VYLAAVALQCLHLFISYLRQPGHLNFVEPLSFDSSFLHDKHFSVGVFIGEKLISEGKGKSKQEAEQESLVILKQTEEKARKTEARMLDDARKKENEMMKNAELLAAAKQEEARKTVEQEAIGLVKSAIAKTVELAPEAVDEALIKKAIREVKGII